MLRWAAGSRHCGLACFHEENLSGAALPATKRNVHKACPTQSDSHAALGLERFSPTVEEAQSLSGEVKKCPVRDHVKAKRSRYEMWNGLPQFSERELWLVQAKRDQSPRRKRAVNLRQGLGDVHVRKRDRRNDPVEFFDLERQ